MKGRRFYEAVDKALNRSRFEVQPLFDALKTSPDLAELFESVAGYRHGEPLPLTLEDHSRSVLNGFERYFASRPLPGGVNRALFRLALALHDIGKPRALRPSGETPGQHRYTAEVLTRIRPDLPIDDAENAIMTALVAGDSIGGLFRGKIAPEAAADEIRNFSAAAGLASGLFLELLTILYQCDAASYTRSGGYPSDWLLTVFEVPPGKGKREPVFDPELKRLRFAPELEVRFDKLAVVLKSRL